MGQQESEARKMLNRCVSSFQYRLTLEADVRRIIDRYISERELMRRHYELFDWRYSRRSDSLISYYLFFNALQQSRNYEQLLRKYEDLLSRSLEKPALQTPPPPTPLPSSSCYQLYSTDKDEYLGIVYINSVGSKVSSVHFFALSMNALSKAVSELTSAYTDNVEEYYKKDPVKIRIFVEGKEFELIVGGTKTPELRPVLRDKEK
jgi:hypothetical protein